MSQLEVWPLSIRRYARNERGKLNRIDLAAAVNAHRWASEVMGLVDATQALKHGAVRTAILLARAQKA